VAGFKRHNVGNFFCQTINLFQKKRMRKDVAVRAVENGGKRIDACIDCQLAPKALVDVSLPMDDEPARGQLFDSLWRTASTGIREPTYPSLAAASVDQEVGVWTIGAFGGAGGKYWAVRPTISDGLLAAQPVLKQNHRHALIEMLQNRVKRRLCIAGFGSDQQKDRINVGNRGHCNDAWAF
jgi:hypothetical protein